MQAGNDPYGKQQKQVQAHSMVLLETTNTFKHFLTARSFLVVLGVTLCFLRLLIKRQYVFRSGTFSKIYHPFYRLHSF